MLLLNDVVDVFAFTHQDIDAGVGFHAFNGRSVGAALVDSDLLWHVVQVDGTHTQSAVSQLYRAWVRSDLKL